MAKHCKHKKERVSAAENPSAPAGSRPSQAHDAPHGDTGCLQGGPLGDKKRWQSPPQHPDGRKMATRGAADVELQCPGAQPGAPHQREGEALVGNPAQEMHLGKYGHSALHTVQGKQG